MTQPIASHQDRRLYAIGIVLTSYVFLTLCDAAGKWMVLSGMPPLQVAFGRYIVQLAFILGLAMPQSGLSVFRTRNAPMLILRGCALLVMTILNFMSLAYLPLTLTGAIMFTIPLIITALSVPFLGEQVGWRRWVAILVGFVGILIIVQPWGADFHWAVFLSLGGSLAGAIYYIMTRKLAGRETTMTMQLYVGAVGTFALLPFVISGWVWPQSLTDWLVFVGVGTAAMIGHQIAIVAHRFAPASVLAPFGYSQIVWMALASWFIFAQPPDFWLLVGAPIVAGSGIYIWLRERKLSRSLAAAAAPSSVDPAPAPNSEKSMN